MRAHSDLLPDRNAIDIWQPDPLIDMAHRPCWEFRFGILHGNENRMPRSHEMELCPTSAFNPSDVSLGSKPGQAGRITILRLANSQETTVFVRTLPKHLMGPSHRRLTQI